MVFNLSLVEEYPAKADLRKDLYKPLPFIPPGTVDPGLSVEEATKQACLIIDSVNGALESDDVTALEQCFFSAQAYWRDILALTAHLRTFATRTVIARALLETKELRGLSQGFRTQEQANFVAINPVLQLIDCWVSFKTSQPAAVCSARIILLPRRPETNQDQLEWRIWTLTTLINDLDVHPENVTLLRSPGRTLDDDSVINTPVFILGGGNAALATAARLKALGVESIMAERNCHVGENWTKRYDCLHLHLPTAACEMPYLSYPKELYTPHTLTKVEMAEFTRGYAETFNLNVITSAKLISALYDQHSKQWTVKLQSLTGMKTVIASHFVQATGIGSDMPYVPEIAGKETYGGVNMHSSEYRSVTQLAQKGVKSVLVIGSGSTAFDLAADCHDAGLLTTMVVRSPTYIFPIEYIYNEHSLGCYTLMSAAAADRELTTFPVVVEGQLIHGLFSHLASLEPDRYKGLAEAGFPVIDSRHPDADVTHHLNELAGGHYVDVGTTVKLIAEGKVGVKSSSEPRRYTATGVCFLDGSEANADAILWCTGFANQDVRDAAASILGGSPEAPASKGTKTQSVLGPRDIAGRLDATWGVDAEGEIRGMWKRHLRMENYWVMGGNLQHQRWSSRVLAQQIKASLEGILPPAYRDTPGSPL